MELTLSDVLRLARRWWWLIILCSLLAAGIAYLVSSWLTPVYQARATLLVEQSQTPGTLGYQDILASQQLTQTYSRLVSTRPVLDEAARQLGGGLTSDDLVAHLAVVPVSGTQLVHISVTDTSPERAAKIANTVGQVFIDQRQTQQAALTGSTRDDLQRSVDGLKQQIGDTSTRIAALQARSDVASESVQSQLTVLQRQLNDLQTTYSGLLEVMQRMNLDVAQATTQIQLVEQAVAPARPVRPRVMLNTVAAGGLGLLVALGSVLAIGYLDDTVKSSEDVRRLTGTYALGLVGALRAPGTVEPLAHPHSAGAESYRALRTSLQFATAGRAARILVVTSAEPAAGKTTTVANLGMVLAQLGQRVVLVDADLRVPRLHTHFAGVTNHNGLTNRLIADADEDPEAFLQPTAIEGLRVLPAGPLPPNPAELLNGPRLIAVLANLLDQADIILLDVPPLAVSDALIVAAGTDGIVVVVRHGRTRSKTLTRTVAELARVGKPLFGVVVNFAQVSGDDAYYYNASYGGPDAEPPAQPRRRLRRLFSRGASSVPASEFER
ncbi:MAG TPA: polysaccharide biosynthesis tyrosine autokinase [Thermomicrobiaceae bacterium]|nr:polysaccharide biosynthesis tyrosine autokinase [Thermomicrobiaceae bacterium]